MKRRLGRVDWAAGSSWRWLRVFVSSTHSAGASCWLFVCLGAIFLGSVSGRPGPCLPSGTMKNEVIVVAPSTIAKDCKANHHDFTLKARALLPSPEASNYTFEQSPPPWPVACGLQLDSQNGLSIVVKDGTPLVANFTFTVTTIQPA